MATITKIANKSGTVYKARIRRPGQPELSERFTYRSDAEKWARKVEADLERDDAGLTSPAHRHTLSACIKQYREERLPELAPGTRVAYDIHLRYWDQQLGRLKLSELRPEKIAKCRDKLRDLGKKTSSVNRYLAALAAVLTRAVKHWHWLDSNPVSRVEKLTEDNARTRFLTEPELGRLLDACRESASPDLYVAVLLSITTGVRRGELMGLRWRDVDLQQGLLHVRVGNETTTKGGVRSVPIVAQVLPLLTERRTHHAEGNVTRLRDDGLVFPSQASKRNPVTVRTGWENACKRAGLEGMHWHDLRHACASFLAKNGATLLEIGEVLGHRSPSTTKRYSHLTRSHTHDLVRGVADKLLGSGRED